MIFVAVGVRMGREVDVSEMDVDEAGTIVGFAFSVDIRVED